MAASNAVDYSKIVLILSSFVGADDILLWSDNSRFEFIPPTDAPGAPWKGGQSEEQELKPPFLCLRIGENIFDPTGWVLGSNGDSDVCDIQIATTNQAGASGRWCKIDISPLTHRPRLTQLSHRKIRIYGETLVSCTQGLPQVLKNPATIDFGGVRCRAWTPQRTANETSRYDQRARSYSEDIMGSIPKCISSTHGYKEASADQIRRGTNAVYVVEGKGTQGNGAHASVFMVKDIVTGRFFGAKEPYYKASDDADAARKRLEDLQMEFAHIKCLDHPHILRAFDLVLAEDMTSPPWMIVEYIPWNLREALPCLNEYDRLTVMIHLNSALSYMHARGITHRDLKPENTLIVTRQGGILVKLADFGTSKRNNSAKMDTFTGTEIYMAPELFIKPRGYTNKIDMWALGMIGMQLFTGWDPDTDSQWDPNNLGSWVRNVALPEIAEATAFLQPLMKGLLRRNAERRWSAWKCLRWLWKHEPVGSAHASFESITNGAVSMEQPASKDMGHLLPDGLKRSRRSPNPRSSTSGAQMSQAQGDSKHLYIAPRNSASPSVLSAELTTCIDDADSDPDKPNEDESSGADTDLEDWQD